LETNVPKNKAEDSHYIQYDNSLPNGTKTIIN
jgi:hypothetical protein